MNSDMIRLYQEEDTEAIVDVWYQASLVAHPFLTAKFLAEEAVRLRELFLPNSQTWVYVYEELVVGFLSLSGHEVGGLFVHPKIQRKGVGHALMDKAKSLHPVLVLDVFEANPIGRAFYAKYGFEEVARTIDNEIGEPLIKLRYAAK